MGKQRNDISQIRKYLDGELDARAMHELERRAQDDPFLMDALDGYENSKADEQKGLDELTARLQQRIEKKEARIIPWRFISIAAAVLVIITVGGLFLLKKQPVPDVKIAQVFTPIEKKETAISPAEPEMKAKDTAPAPPMVMGAPYIASRKKIKDTASNKMVAAADVGANMIASEPPSSESAAPAEPQQEALKSKPSVPLNEMIASNYAAQKTKPDSLHNGYFATQKALPGRVAAVTVNDGYVAHTGELYPVIKTIRGTVIAKDDGDPIAGAVVKVDGAKFGAVTDASGKFVLPNVSNNAMLAVSYIGYESRKVSLNKNDSLAITLNPDNKSLNEVVVAGLGAEKDDSETNLTGPHPKNGWHALKKYLIDNAASLDGKVGKVKLSFMVDGSGNLSDFHISKSLSTDADSKAISLIENGPEWSGASDGKPAKVKLIITFN